MQNLLSLDRMLTYHIAGSMGIEETIILTPFYSKGTLHKAMIYGDLDERRCSAALQMIRGLMNIHAQGAIHGDLKLCRYVIMLNHSKP